MGVHFIRHPCLTRKLRVLAPAAPKIIPRSLSGRKCSGAGLSNCACSVGFASCETLGKHYHASLRLRSLGSLHLCIDSHLCRCIVQRLCVAVFMHPCIKTLGDRHRASMHDPQVAGSPTHQHTKSVTPLIEWGYTFWCRWRGSNPHGIATNGF